MDLNLIVLAGTLAAPPEHRTFESGAAMTRFLVTVHADEPRRRVDVIPVIRWNEDLSTDRPVDADPSEFDTGDRVWVAGSIRRRFWATPDGRRSRLEVIAQHIQGETADGDVGRSMVDAMTGAAERQGGADASQTDIAS